MGLAMRKVGETAVVPVADFSLEGKSKQNLRTAINRAEREGARLRGPAPRVGEPHRRRTEGRVGRLAGGPQRAEKAFSLGRFDPAYLDLTPLAVVRQTTDAAPEGRIVAFANLLPGEGDEREVAIDLMRHTPDAPPG
jgi:phosphatidylglycerol lysyltransferase